nr:PREDICTED: cingulin-like protein 1 [Lepisosteus oculatus]
MLGEDMQRYREEAGHLQNFSDKVSRVMEEESCLGTVGKDTRRISENGTSILHEENVSLESSRSHAHLPKQTAGSLPPCSLKESSTSHQNGDESPVISKSPLNNQTVNCNGKSYFHSEPGSKAGTTNKNASIMKVTGLKRSGSVKELIHKFSGNENAKISSCLSPTGDHKMERKSSEKSCSDSELMEESKTRPETFISTCSESDKGTLNKERTTEDNKSPQPSFRVISAPCQTIFEQKHATQDGSCENLPVANDSTNVTVGHDTSQNNDSLPSASMENALTLKEPQTDSYKKPERSSTGSQSSNSKANQNPIYKLFLGGEGLENISRNTDSRASENGQNGNSPYLGLTNNLDRPSSRLGSMESLASRDWDTMSDKLGGSDSPSRGFNSPYKNIALDYDRPFRVLDYKEGLSPSTSESNLYSPSFNSTSSSPVPSPTVLTPRSRFTGYDSLTRVKGTISSLSSMRPGMQRRDYIEELTRLLDTCQKRNQFLEAESIEMNKERNQIRYEMRGILVNNEDLLRTNTQMQGELMRLRERIMELERENTMMNERFSQLESELREAREVMVEANAQEYAFNFLQQSLKNKIQDAEENLGKQNQHAQSLSEKLWLAERKQEEYEQQKQDQDKMIMELNSKLLRIETELAEALQAASQATAELNLHQKLKDDSQLRMKELEEGVLQKTQELQRAQQTVSRLQGEVSDKLFDKEKTLEEEIQLRERLQLQCKQAERSLEDLQMELQTAAQSKEELTRQLRLAQEKIIELEVDLEEMHDAEQRWASKHKRAVEQNEQLQLKMIQERDLREQVECEKTVLERQIRDLRVELHELQNSRVQEEVVSRAEIRVKELESSLRTEERNKIVLTNNIGKLERKIKELTDQLEEDHKLAEEQKDLMAQRIRSLKRQLNEAEEEMSRRDTQYRHTQRELAEERETNSRLQRQLLDQQIQLKRKESVMVRQTLSSLKLDLDSQDEDEELSK